MKYSRLLPGILGLLTVLAWGCGGSSSGGGSSDRMDLELVSNGFGELLPHKVRKLVNGEPADPEQIIPITDRETLLANVTAGNPILPVTRFENSAILPTGAPGNHFLYATFRQPIDIDSVLDSSPGAQSSFGLSGTVTLVSIDPSTGNSSPVRVRVFLDGKTYAGTPVVDPNTGDAQVPLQTWVTLAGGRPVPVPGIDNDLDGTPDGLGFPGTEEDFPSSADLVSPRTLVFVADSDGNLATHETFPVGQTIKLRITTGVRATNGKPLVRQAVAASTVGLDGITPEIATSPSPALLPLISPGQGDSDVDPLTNVLVEFTEPVQPLTVGDLPTASSPLISAAIRIEFGPTTARVLVPFTAEPVSVYDLTLFELAPIFNFPGEGPDEFECGLFNKVDVTALPQQIADLAGNINGLGAHTDFKTGEGAGIVNAPVSPDVIYVGRGGAVPGLSVIDLNGFGAGTGNPTFDPTHPIIEGNSNYPNNPNVALQGPSMLPQLPSSGSCTINGGSSGVFTLARDSALQDLVARAPIMSAAGDMMIGHALDATFNNGPFPFGCQAQGGNLCAFDGKKNVSPIININSMTPALQGQFGTVGVGVENLACWSPHPNPPPLNFPPLCVSPFLGGLEPTSIDTTAVTTNLLTPGSNALGIPATNTPPSTLLTPEQNTFFLGPSLPQPGAPVSNCTDYQQRQQVGHYLYIADRGRRELLIMNSNRMTVIDRIPMPDPTALAMSPNVDLLAVSNQSADFVSFLDIDPASATFHQIVRTTPVGRRPRGIAWEPGNEDILVCNESDNSISIIAAAALQVRRVVRTNLDRPFDLAVTPRQLPSAGFGFNRDVYFAWILNRNGRVALFESGPSGINGWGFDDVIGVSTQTFKEPKTIQPDYINLNGACWIVHEGPLNPQTGNPGAVGVGAVSNLAIVSAVPGRLPLNNTNFFANPNIRDMELGVVSSIGEDQLSGVPVDIAFDNLRNLAGAPNVASGFSAGSPVLFNGKGLVRAVGGGVVNNTTPLYMLAAVPNPFQGSGVIDVLRLTGFRQDTNPFDAGVQSIPVPDVRAVMDYFRQ